LVKAYSGYYRFSEDIDFTWADQGTWSTVTPSKRNALCAKEAEEIIHHIKEITDRAGLLFSGKKAGEDVHISSGGKMLTLHPTYYSAVGRMRSEVKIEVNLFDLKSFPYQERMLGTYIDGAGFETLENLHKGPYRNYTTPVELTCYGLREIFVEKCRALMTRRTYKPRDSLDLYQMSRTVNLDVPGLKEDIARKVGFALDVYERYIDQIDDNDLSKLRYDRRDDNLLLCEMPEDLESSIVIIHEELEKVRKELVSKVHRER